MDSKDLEYLKRLSNQRRQSHKRNFLYLKDRRYPGWQLVGWMVTEILFVIGTSLPYWARREIINVSFRELGLGRLDVRYGIWVVCVDGIGSTCYNWNKLYKLDPDGVSDLQLIVQIVIGTALISSILAGISNIIWIVQSSSIIVPKTPVHATIGCNLVAGTGGILAVILYCAAYARHALNAWCLFTTLAASAGFISLVVSASCYKRQSSEQPRLVRSSIDTDSQQDRNLYESQYRRHSSSSVGLGPTYLSWCKVRDWQYPQSIFPCNETFPQISEGNSSAEPTPKTLRHFFHHDVS